MTANKTSAQGFPGREPRFARPICQESHPRFDVVDTSLESVAHSAQCGAGAAHAQTFAGSKVRRLRRATAVLPADEQRFGDPTSTNFGYDCYRGVGIVVRRMRLPCSGVRVGVPARTAKEEVR